jgi:hypothetical protein
MLLLIDQIAATRTPYPHPGVVTDMRDPPGTRYELSKIADYRPIYLKYYPLL